ncbi:MAG: hypothetical protein AAF708_02165 [Deinococcota bacterium]
MSKPNVRLAIALCAYAVVLAASLYVMRWQELDTLSRILLSLSPMVPVVFVARAVWQRIHQLDELQRKIQLEALTFAFVTTALLSLTYGFLENVGVPKLSMFVVWPLMAASWVLGLVLRNARY